MKRGADSLEIEGEDHLGDRRGDGEIQVRGLEWRAGGNGVESTRLDKGYLHSRRCEIVRKKRSDCCWGS